jgi:hypothetical protein
MQFTIIARDYTDSEALTRRIAAREAHIALSEKAKARGEQLFGVAMLNEQGKMCGSIIVVELPSRKEGSRFRKSIHGLLLNLMSQARYGNMSRLFSAR